MHTMKYFGVSNSYVKSSVTNSRSYEYIEISPENLTFDCIRHFDLLKRYENGEDLKKSYYFAFYKFFSNKDDGSIDKKIQNYIALYREIKNNGYSNDVRGYTDIAVTANGIRLNGSHRASIAYCLGLKKLKVKCVRWNLLHLPLERERRKKDFYYELFKDKQVYKDGSLLGRIVYTDWVPLKNTGSLLGRTYHVLDTMRIVDARGAHLE